MSVWRATVATQADKKDKSEEQDDWETDPDFVVSFSWWLHPLTNTLTDMSRTMLMRKNNDGVPRQSPGQEGMQEPSSKSMSPVS